jgi:predicted phage terminase large subunit-like protein
MDVIMDDIPTDIKISDLLKFSPFYFGRAVFGYRVDGAHEKILSHMMESNNSLILAPRGHGKSLMMSVYITWLLVNNPNIRILLISETDRKAQMFLSKIKAILQHSSIIKEYYGDLVGEKWTDHALTLKTRTEIFAEPSILATGSGSSTVVGTHVNVICCDDLVGFDASRSDIQRDRLLDWYRTSLLPCGLAGVNIIICGTRYHYVDLYQHHIDTFKYDTLILPAINPDGTALIEWLQPLEDTFDSNGNLLVKGLKTIRSDLGEIIFALQYSNDVELLKEGNIIKYNDLRWYDSLYHDENNQVYVIRNDNKKIKIGKIILGNDPAISEKSAADDSAFIVAGMGTDNNIYILESINKKLSFDKQINMIEHLVERWQPNAVNIEQVAYQAALITELKRRGGLKIHDITPGRDKTSRTMGVTGFFEDHRVHLKKSMQALTDQLILFPDGKNDDLVDACTYSLIGMKYGTVEPISISF